MRVLGPGPGAKGRLDAALRRKGYNPQKFVATDAVINAVMSSEPSCRHFAPPVPDEYAALYHGRRAIWIGSPGVMVRIPSDNVLFMEGNAWNFAHAACIREYLEQGGRFLKAPAARVYRIKAKDVKYSERQARAGNLEYDLGMAEAWTRADVGSYYAQLLDGNHRAAAALAVGEPFIWVYVGPDYRGNVFKKDLK